MINNKLHIKLFANCIPVKGANRSSICDLQRNEVKLIPNDLYKILTGNTTQIGNIKSNFDNKFDETIDEYFNFLIDNELAFTTETPELFPELSKEWHEPTEINNAILDISEKSDYNILDALIQIDNLNCKNIQIRFFKTTTIKDITRILEFLETEQSFITSVDFIFPYTNKESIKNDCDLLIAKHKRINSLTVYNYIENDFIPPTYTSDSGCIIYTTENITSNKHCGIISPNLFAINIKNYTEGLTNNSCLNKKISIDEFGTIKNCPSMSQGFGNIIKTNLNSALNKRSFKKHWDITKDQIEVCKDCEFRHICTDCRAYKEDPEDMYSKPLKCGYDPYTNQWEDWSTNPLKQKAIRYYKL